MHYLKMLILIVTLCITSTSWAAPRLLHGAGTLPQGDKAVSLGIGASLPQQAGYNLAFDYGVTDWLQLGASGGYAVLVATAGLTSAVDFLAHQDSGHHVGLRFNPHFVYLNGIFAEMSSWVFDPTLAYEYQFGTNRQTGLFVKAGTQHWRAKVKDNIIGVLFDAGEINITKWAHTLRFSGGVQHQFGQGFSLTAEGGALTRMRLNKAIAQGQVGLAWAF
jgi:hypothetical protein